MTEIQRVDEWPYMQDSAAFLRAILFENGAELLVGIGICAGGRPAVIIPIEYVEQMTDEEIGQHVRSLVPDALRNQIAYAEYMDFENAVPALSRLFM